MEPIIKLENVSFSYPERGIIFEDLNFEIYKGDRIGIKGPNGSGKTTLLYIIVGLLKPQKGKVIILGKNMEKENDFYEVRKKIGFLFQDSDDQLFYPTVEEDIAFGPLNLKIERRKVREIVDKTIKELGIENLRKRITGTLSYGEKRIVAIATIFSMEPEILLLDEPTSGLDEDTEEKIKKILISKKDITLCIVSHEINFIRDVCNKIYLLENGKLKQINF